jgi:hypothetical protein
MTDISISSQDDIKHIWRSKMAVETPTKKLVFQFEIISYVLLQSFGFY